MFIFFEAIATCSRFFLTQYPRPCSADVMVKALIGTKISCAENHDACSKRSMVDSGFPASQLPDSWVMCMRVSHVELECMMCSYVQYKSCMEVRSSAIYRLRVKLGRQKSKATGKGSGLACTCPRIEFLSRNALSPVLRLVQATAIRPTLRLQTPHRQTPHNNLIPLPNTKTNQNAVLAIPDPSRCARILDHPRPTSCEDAAHWSFGRCPRTRSYFDWSRNCEIRDRS